MVAQRRPGLKRRDRPKRSADYFRGVERHRLGAERCAWFGWATTGPTSSRCWSLRTLPD